MVIDELCHNKVKMKGKGANNIITLGSCQFVDLEKVKLKNKVLVVQVQC